MKNLKFILEDGIWYCDLPDYPGDREDCIMVAGADTVLDSLDHENKGIVEIQIDTKEFDGYTMKLSRLFKIGGGATYFANGYGIKMPVWLCKVTKYVFEGTLPKKLYLNL